VTGVLTTIIALPWLATRFVEALLVGRRTRALLVRTLASLALHTGALGRLGAVSVIRLEAISAKLLFLLLGVGLATGLIALELWHTLVLLLLSVVVGMINQSPFSLFPME
jgi:hypothetical protein